MNKKRRHSKRKRAYSKKNQLIIPPPFLALLLFILLAGFVLITSGDALSGFVRNVLAGKRSGGGGYDNTAGCAGLTTRPCFDKLTGSDVNLLGKNGSNAFTSCTSNAASNKVGEFIHKTTVCGQEKVVYCHDGRSANFLRKFTGDCSNEPPPPPPPTPEPTMAPTSVLTPTSGAISPIPFRILYPNGGEQLPFGSQITVRWEGGDTISSWPVYLSIVDRDRNVAIREMVINTPNDGQEQWIVDLPLGNYYVYYGQGCRNSTCASASQWDQSNNKFSVVAGTPVEKVNSTYPLNQSLVALLPSGGETWGIGSNQTIKWSGGAADWKIRLYLMDNANNTTYSVLFTDLANTGSQQWTIPEYIPPGQYKLYVSCGNCSAAPSGYTGGLYTYSFYPFTIQ